MTLVPLVEKAETAGVTRAALERGEELWGRPLNAWLALANTPDLLAVCVPFLHAVQRPGDLNQRIKELAAVQVALHTHCPYSASRCCASALANGVTEAELSALATGDTAGFSEPERLALELARELTERPVDVRYEEAPQIASPQLLDAVRDTFPPAPLVELVLTIAAWNGLARFHRTLGLELDMPEPPPAVRSAL